MKVTIICVGKIKEDFYRKAVSEYEKRLSRYCKLDIIEVQDEKTPDNASPALEEQIKEREAARIFKYIKEDAHVISCLKRISVGRKAIFSLLLADLWDCIKACPMRRIRRSVFQI